MRADPLFDSFDPECIDIHGGIGCGKSFLAATISQFWPGNIAERTKGTGKKVVLEDIFWFIIDSNAIAGFSIIGVECPSYNLQKVMGIEAEWKKVGFARKPSLIEAVNKYGTLLKDRVAKGLTRFAVVDTVTGLDGSLINYHRKMVENDASLSGNKFALWQLNYAAHQLFHDTLKFSGVNILYCMHSKSVDEETIQAKKKNQTVLMAGGATFAPAISGQSAAVYKRDATMQLLVKASVIPGKKGHEAKSRKVITDISSDGETKQRYAGILPQEAEPNLRAMYATIRKAQARWK